MQQMHEASRRNLQAEAGLQQVGDLGQRQAAARVQVDAQLDHAGAELCAGRPQRIGGLQRVATLDTPPTLRAVADPRCRSGAPPGAPGEGPPDTVPPRRSRRPRRRSPGTSSAPAPPRPRRRARARPASLPAIARTRPSPGTHRRDPAAASWRRVRLAGVPPGARLPTAVSGARSRAAGARSDAASRPSHGARSCGAPARHAVA